MKKLILVAIAFAITGAGSADAQIVYSKKSGPSGYLGLSFREEASTESKTTETIRVGQVSKDSPADKAGVKAGDEIVRINGMVAANGKFSAVARTLVEGDTVRLRIKRQGTERDVTIIAAARPAGMAYARDIIIAPDSLRRRMLRYLDSARVHLDSLKLPNIYIGRDSLLEFHIRRHDLPHRELRELHGEVGPGAFFHSMELGARAIGGAEFSEMDESLAQYFNGQRGLLTLRVLPETPSDRAGLQAGDVVRKANGRAVDEIQELRSIIGANPAGVKLEVSRKGQIRTLELKTRSR